MNLEEYEQVSTVTRGGLPVANLRHRATRSLIQIHAFPGECAKEFDRLTDSLRTMDPLKSRVISVRREGRAGFIVTEELPGETSLGEWITNLEARASTGGLAEGPISRVRQVAQEMHLRRKATSAFTSSSPSILKDFDQEPVSAPAILAPQIQPAVGEYLPSPGSAFPSINTGHAVSELGTRTYPQVPATHPHPDPGSGLPNPDSSLPERIIISQAATTLFQYGIDATDHHSREQRGTSSAAAGPNPQAATVLFQHGAAQASPLPGSDDFASAKETPNPAIKTPASSKVNPAQAETVLFQQYPGS